MKVLKILIISIFLLVAGIVGINLALEPLVIPQPFWLKAKVSLDGTVLTGTDNTLTIKVTNTSGTEFKPVDTQGSSFGAVTAGRFSYNIPKYDATDQKEGAQTNQKGCISLYKSGMQLKMSYPAQGSCPANSGEITIGGDGESIGFGISATYQFTDPITVTSPVPAATMSYDGTSISSGGTIPFGTVNVNTPKKITFKIQNTGDTGSTLNVTNIALGGADSNRFALSSTTDISLAKDASGTIDITFTPVADTNYAATLTFKVNTGTGGATNDVTINLTGSGHTPIPGLEMKYDSTSVTNGGTIPFGTVVVGNTKTIILNIKNTGETGTTLNITSIALGGQDAARFNLSSTQDLSIAKDSSANIGITYTPQGDASHNANISFKANTGSAGALQDVSINLTATSMTEPVANVALGGDVQPAGGFIGGINFGNVDVGSTSAEKEIKITNSGNYNLVIGAITQGGASDQFKSTSDTCSGKTISPGNSCSVKGTFNPTKAGNQNATLTFATNRLKTGDGKDNPTDTTTVITLMGKGVQMGFTVDPTSLDFGTLTLPDTPNKTMTVVVTNTGTDPLTAVTPQITSGAQFSTPTNPFGLAVDASATVQVVYTAKSGTQTGTLTITSGSISKTVSLTGKAVTRPGTPTNQQPQDGSTNVSLTPTLQASAFVAGDEGAKHAGSAWVVKDPSGNIIYQSSKTDASGNIVFDWDTNNLTALIVPKGILKFGTTYTWQVIYKDSNGTTAASYSTATSFTTMAKPSGYDDYGVPTAATEVTYKDASGNTKTQTNLNTGTDFTTLKNTPSFVSAVPQISTVEKVVTSGAVGNIPINTTNVSLVKASGGTSTQSVVMIPQAGTTFTSITPIDTTGKTIKDASGNTETAITGLNTSGYTLPYGLFEINLTVPAGASANVVILPPSASGFAAGTKWYKVNQATGTLVEYPHFTVDASGNGILTLWDNGAGDSDPRNGAIRDPGGPGVAGGGAVDVSGGGTSGCFIATAAFGSYFDPYVNILRNFRDMFLMTNKMGQIFVNWYYRVSPPIADFIARHNAIKAMVRIMLLPAVGFSALSLKIGIFGSLILIVVLLGTLIFIARRLYRYGS